MAVRNYEVFSMYMLCRHIKTDGTRCESPALLNKPYCYFHDHYLREAGKSLKKAKKLPIALPRLINRRSILEALSDVIGALGAGHLDTSTAGRLIYGLQVAGQFAHDYTPRHTPKAVESFTITEDGAEIAEEDFFCEADEPCEGCPRVEICDVDVAKEFRAARDSKPATEEDNEESKNSGDDDNGDDDDEENDE